MFDKLLGGKQPDPSESNRQTAAGVADPAQDPNMIRVYDSYGRELFITREQWRESVLLGNIEKAWDNPDHLASLIIQSLHDGFYDDMLGSAKRLVEIDQNPERSYVLLGIVNLKLKQVDEAERILNQYIEKYGVSGVILTNLAKVHAERGENDRALETLWRGLESDPNQDNGFEWYVAICRDRGGEAGFQEACRQVAALRGSWRAQLWLARAALQQKDLTAALGFYAESLENAGRPVPADLLMQMSGDLGNHGYCHELLRLTAPHFDVRLHGLMVGNNLIKGYVETGQVVEAARLLDLLHSQNRPDWKQTLNYWDTEIARKRIAGSPTQASQPLKMVMLTIDGPIWLNTGSPASSLFPSHREAEPLVCVFGSSAETGRRTDKIEQQVSDGPGRLSRALPLLLAEQMHFHGRFRVRTLIPWIAEGGGGFVLAGRPWGDGDALRFANQTSPSAAYVVLVHVMAATEPWEVSVRLIRAADASCLTEWKSSFSPASPGDDLLEVAEKLRSALQESQGDQSPMPESCYEAPRGPILSHYLLRLEQLLAVRCQNTERTASDFLYGEREILDGNLQMCLQQPANPTLRLLLAQTLMSMKQCRPDVVAEFGERARALQRQHPLTDPVQRVIDRMVQDALTI